MVEVAKGRERNQVKIKHLHLHQRKFCQCPLRRFDTLALHCQDGWSSIIGARVELADERAEIREERFRIEAPTEPAQADETVDRGATVDP